MNWKFIIVFAITLLSTNSYSGGVDVGNGGLTLSYDIVIDHGFRSEQDLVSYLDERKFQIESGQEYNLRLLVDQNNCNRKIKLKQMSVEKFYPYKDGMILPKEYKGLLKINLENCKN